MAFETGWEGEAGRQTPGEFSRKGRSRAQAYAGVGRGEGGQKERGGDEGGGLQEEAPRSRGAVRPHRTGWRLGELCRLWRASVTGLMGLPRDANSGVRTAAQGATLKPAAGSERLEPGPQRVGSGDMAGFQAL